MLINQTNLALLTQAVNASFMVGITNLQAGAADWPMLAMTVPSGTAENIYPYLKSLGAIREWVGDRVIQNLTQGDFRIANKDFEETHAVPRKAVEDDQYGLYNLTFQQTGQNVQTFPGKQVYGLLKQGFTTLCPDGQYFFDTDHPVGKPGAEVAVANFMGGSGEPWFVIDANKVFKPIIWQPRKSFNLVTMFDESDSRVFWQREYVYGVDGRAGIGFSPFWQLAFASKQTPDATAVRAILTAMSSQKDDNGNPLAISGTHVVCGPALAETMNDLFTKEILANGESNTMRGRLKVIVSPWLL